ncbi:MAG: DUF2125 domain-containing protein [Rhizobiales bacterium]|nr:DUF2125 domain-containing protein [Hyphomicrobiales bacterium]
MTVDTGRRGGNYWIFAPLVFLLLLAAAWSVLWFYAARRAETTVADWLEREAQSGRTHACASRSVGGYPFRIEMHCAEPLAQIHGVGQPMTLRAASLLAVAQIYDPTLVIAELTGPLRIEQEGAAPLSVNWKLLQASLRGFPLGFERASVAIDEPSVSAADQAGEPLAKALHIEFHARRRPGEGPLIVDLASTVQSLLLTFPAQLANKPIEGTIEASVTGLKDFAPQPFNERLRQWQADGGKLEISRIRFAQGDVIATAKGELSLTPQARPEGSLNVTLAGIEQAGALLLGQSSQGRTQAALLGGLAMLAGRTELEGRRAIALPLRVRDGTISLGPLTLGHVDPLY